jgi:transmembrane sensor
MTPVTDLATEHAIRAWTRRHSGAWTEADEAHLVHWLAAAAEHRVAYEAVTRAWDAAGRLEGRVQRCSIARRQPLYRPLAVACTIVLLAALSIPLGRSAYSWWSGTPAHWSTPLGQPRALVLGDGTQVLLDADSEIVAQIGAGARHVSLERGEALFSVAHDAFRSFEVDSGAGRITDLGTRFDVEILSGAAHVSVLQGRVEVSTHRGGLVLGAGQGGGYDRDGAFLTLRAVDAAAGVSLGVLRQFNAEPLADVLERLRRYHRVTFIYTDPKLKDLRLSGAFRIDNLPLFLHTLSAALPVETRSLDSQRFEVSPAMHPGSHRD